VQGKSLGSVVEARFRTRAGTYHRFEVRGRAALDVVGVDGIVLGLRDVTDRRRWEVGGGDEVLLRAIIDAAPGITMLLDGDGVVRGASRALTTTLGRAIDVTIGAPLVELAEPADRDAVLAGVARAASTPGSVSFEATFTRADGRPPVPLSITVANLLLDAAVAGLVVSAIDITPLAEARARLRHLASHDVLTGLPNRSLLNDRIDLALAVARRRGTAVTVIYCDIDRFKAVNDRHGHRAGDWVLVELGRRLQLASREGDTVARIGGERFLLPNGRTLEVSVSVGVGVTAGGDVEDALAAADAAMYAAKRARAATGVTVPA
jgi:PAS domain S-box-containing protein